MILFFGCAEPEIISLDQTGIVPLPSEISAKEGYFTFDKNTKVYLEAGNTDLSKLISFFNQATGQNLETTDSSGENVLVLHISNTNGMDREEYNIEIGSDKVEVKAADPAGLFYGLITLQHLINTSEVLHKHTSISNGTIRDKPEYAYRGMMLDVARHFFPVDDIKHLIDLLAHYKINHLHLGLTNDQGWRIEIKSWPYLAKIGGSTEVGGGDGGYYSQEQYKDIVSYAADRFIVIVPEIDMPGHTNSATAAYGILNPGIKVPDKGSVIADRVALGVEETDDNVSPLYTGIEVGFSTLDTNSEHVQQFVDDVIRELAEMTPGPYIHIGGDESHVTEMVDYIPFIEMAQQIVNKYGKKTIGWDEVAHADLLPTSVAQYWAKAENALLAIEQGAKVLISPATKAYLDMQYDSTTHLGLHWAAYVELDDAYNWDPTNLEEGIQRQHILGVEAPLWTETITNRSEMEYMIFPRLPAIAEIAWTAKDRRDWDSFAQRIRFHGKLWENKKINFYASPKVDWK